MIVTDTNVIVALLNINDQKHRLARADLDRLSASPLITTTTVLAEVCHLLKDEPFRVRLADLIFTTPFEVVSSGPDWQQIMGWLIKYADHAPDWVDAELVLLASVLPNAKVWSYDKEFWTIWRRPDGSAVSMATPRRA